MPAKDFIVAIELGSSRLRGIAGRKNSDGSITVLAVASEESSSVIRKGIVYNIDKTVQCITNIMNKLKAMLNREISQVYVGVGGQSILSVRNEISRDLSKGTIVTQQMVNELMDANRNKEYDGKEILDVAIQEYKVGNDLQNDPAGIQTDHLTGNFLNILWRKEFYDKLNDCFSRANVRIAELDIAPLALADRILDDTCKRAGCLLVDFGAETTTMLVYHKNILRHIAVIPLGSSNITKDIASLKIDEDLAEKMKIKYGCAYTDVKELDKSLDYSIDAEHSVASIKFLQVVEARTQEIIDNVWAQVPQEYRDKLNGGIVITGGGANLRNIAKAFVRKTKMEKVVVKLFINDSVNAASKNVSVPHDGTMNTLLGLLLKGDVSCDGGELNHQRDIFEDNEIHKEPKTVYPAEQPATAVAGTTGIGRVSTPAEKDAQEKIRRAAEKKEWDQAVLDNTAEAYERYITAYPGGEHVAEAEDKIAALKKHSMGSRFSKFKKWVIGQITEEE